MARFPFSRHSVRNLATALVLASALLEAGCGTTRVTDTTRTATEQLLVSNSIDQAISEMDFTILAGKPVYFDSQYLDGVTDKGYLIASLQQHLLASGCLLQEDKAKATYVVVARAGAVGTDRNELLFGVPQLNIPSVVPGQPAGLVPEIPLAKKTDKKGVAKVAVYAYNRVTGRPVWQSGVHQALSTAKDTWLLGAGPFQNGTVMDGTEKSGQQVQVPLVEEGEKENSGKPLLPSVTQAAYWQEPAEPVGGEIKVAKHTTLEPPPPIPNPANVPGKNPAITPAASVSQLPDLKP
ncbi:MAG: hypothetical protein JO112_09480 [Planctomycetes bacterium]|nr:hypothetical protein [Planctomycetota bacterium]